MGLGEIRIPGKVGRLNGAVIYSPVNNLAGVAQNPLAIPRPPFQPRPVFSKSLFSSLPAALGCSRTPSRNHSRLKQGWFSEAGELRAPSLPTSEWGNRTPSRLSEIHRWLAKETGSFSHSTHRPAQDGPFYCHPVNDAHRKGNVGLLDGG